MASPPQEKPATTSERLPRAQRAVWEELVAAARRDGRLPAPHQLAAARGIAHSTLRQHLLALAGKGLLEVRSAGRGRTPALALTMSGRRLAGLGGLPVLGAIPAGRLSDAVQEAAAYLSLPARPGWFGLRVSGDSMADLIVDGDIVVLQPEAEPRQNEVCAVRVGESAVTLKRLRWRDGIAQLLPHNPRYPVQEAPLEEVRVEGVFRGLLRGEVARVLEDGM
ncbi:MAG TPA: S24 family peptidase [Deinococcales bacterium]|nr:S24 family peptidase [Deinococcales bacterium]